MEKMSYDRIGNAHIRENGKKRNIFDKVNEIKIDIKGILPEIEGDRLIAMLSKIRTYYGHKKRGVPMGRKGWKGYRDLTINERLLYDYMLKKKLTPSTTYRWFIATRIPSDVKDKLAKGQLTVKKAMQISANRRRVEMSNQGLLLLEKIRTVMRGI
ncbi:hypothetical protein BVX95_02015 [archaeon D22]|nr:hypothetical protein BVX95_02015 [archaeon D22]